MEKLEFNSDKKTKLAYINELTSKTFSNLTLIVIRPVIAQFNPIKLKQPLDKYEGVRIQFRRENKGCLTQ